MKAIYSCKLYKTHPRKDKIKAAISNPINTELVSQLRSYLDDEYQPLADRPEPDVADDLREDADDLSSDVNDGGSSGSLGPRPTSGSLSAKFDALLGDEGASDDFTDSDMGDLDSDADDVDDTDLDTEDETAGELEEIGESTSISTSTDVNLTDAVKSSLCQYPELSKFNRVLEKNNELWIYYNDDVNLNNIMGSVIEQLVDDHLDQLEFNRLARSDNAIVFQVSTDDLQEVSTEEELASE